MRDFLLRGRESCDVILRIKLDQAPKTNKQLGYYFGVVCKYALIGFRNVGYAAMTMDQVDYELRMMFYYVEIPNNQTGEMKRYVGSLSAGSKEQVSDFIDNCVQFCTHELGVPVPAPDERISDYQIESKQ